MAVNNVPANQVGTVVQGFVDNGSRIVIAEQEGNGTTYTVGEPAGSPGPATAAGPSPRAPAKPTVRAMKPVAKRKSARGS